MSLFQNINVPCPGCGKPVSFLAVSSVNADRRPDLRDEILDGTFQRKTCDHCQTAFRLDPEMTYVDIGRGQWIAVQPFGFIGDWEALESQARAAFDRGYGAKAPPPARLIGAQLVPRITFGWEALREKLFLADNKLNDLEVELTKTAILRGGGDVPLSAKTELRVVDAQGDSLTMVWLVAETSEVVEKLVVPRGLYDEIAADKTGWKELRDELSGRLFVDMQRLMLPVA